MKTRVNRRERRKEESDYKNYSLETFLLRTGIKFISIGRERPGVLK